MSLNQIKSNIIIRSTCIWCNIFFEESVEDATHSYLKFLVKFAGFFVRMLRTFLCSPGKNKFSYFWQRNASTGSIAHTSGISYIVKLTKKCGKYDKFDFQIIIMICSVSARYNKHWSSQCIFNSNARFSPKYRFRSRLLMRYRFPISFFSRTQK